MYLLWGYHPGGLTGLPDLSTNVVHILKSRREIPSGFIRTQAIAFHRLGTLAVLRG